MSEPNIWRNVRLACMDLDKWIKCAAQTAVYCVVLPTAIGIGLTVAACSEQGTPRRSDRIIEEDGVIQSGDAAQDSASLGGAGGAGGSAGTGGSGGVGGSGGTGGSGGSGGSGGTGGSGGDGGSSPAASCIASGGTIRTQLCCGSAGDFPNLCLTGPCSCSPSYSHEVQVCDCPSNQCFNGAECQ